MQTFNCIQCGEIFTTKKACRSRIPKYCSSKCFGLSISKIKTCKHCGEKFINYQNKYYCSVKCSGQSKIGSKLSENHKKKLSEARKGRFMGDKHNRWKGDKVEYGALHEWVYSRLGSPNKCELCGVESENNRKIHWANKSHEYKRDVSDWIRLCVRCHKRYDLDNLEKRKSKTRDTNSL